MLAQVIALEQILKTPHSPTKAVYVLTRGNLTNDIILRLVQAGNSPQQNLQICLGK